MKHVLVVVFATP